jgi:hypothetical protein
MVSCEMHSALTSRIYKNGVQTSASGGVSPNSQWSIPMFRAEFLTFALKIVEHSRHLPEPAGNWAECSTESAPMLEFLAQGSIKAEPPWLVPLPERKIPRNEWKFVIHLLFEK